MWLDATILVFLMLCFESDFSLSSFTFTKRLFISSSLIWACWYFSWQSWFQLVSHSAWHIAWSTLNMLNELDVKQPCHILSPNFKPVSCSMSVSNCCFLTCIQVSKKPGKVAWYSQLFKNFPQFLVIHSQRLSYSQIKQKWTFFWNSLAFSMIHRYWQFDFLFLFSKFSFYIWKFLVHILLKPSLKDFEHFLASMWKEYNCMVVWTFFDITCLWNWDENFPFPVLWPLLSFPNLLTYWVQHFNSGKESASQFRRHRFDPWVGKFPWRRKW